MIKRSLFSAVVLVIFCAMLGRLEGNEPRDANQGGQPPALAAVPQTAEEIEAWWKAGRTLPLATAQKYPQNELNVKDDTGINVLIDMAHKCDFFTLWTLGDSLNRRGLRTVGSHATLDSVLTPGSPCRVRIPVGPKLFPFAWWPAARFNVVLTEGGLNDPGYTAEELAMLDKFIRDGGGLVVSGSWVRDDESGKAWSLNAMLGKYGAAVLAGAEVCEGKRWPALKVNEEWEVVASGDGGKPIHARRRCGKGRVVLLASSGMYRFDRKSRENVDEKCGFLVEALKWAAAGSPPVAGDKRLPKARWGGGGIYPESEKNIEGIVCFFSKNQIPKLVQTVESDFPAITKDLYAWLPSPKPDEPMYMILCSGGGGGWAVNAYLPKEASTISTSPDGIRSIFGHEQAHTMAGPCDAASHPFGGNRGEEHAGWFQGKINAKYNGVAGPTRGCNGVFRKEYDGTQKTADQIFKKEHLEKWQGGHDRLMIWYVWQKLDDRYGPTWYPRWRWVQGQRWTEDASRKLTWEESIEDMSIAVGEDLFAFFAKTGKKLGKERFEKARFLDQSIPLPIAPIEPTPAGDVCLDPIGDYTKPITPKQ